MPTAAAIATVLAVLLALQALAWLVVIVFAGKARRALPDLWREPDEPNGTDEPVDPATDGEPLVSVIVPAHDEEERIAACVRSMLDQRLANPTDIELIVVLDRCTDDTLGVVRRTAGDDARVRIVEIDRCPEGWAGKTNAAANGAAVARGRRLLFTDADVDADPSLVHRALSLAARERAGLLSLLSTLTYDRDWERTVQPVALLVLMRLYPLERMNRPERPRPFANGQFLLFERAAFDAIEGFAAVRESIIEDIDLSRAVHDSGRRAIVATGEGLLRVRMYETLDQLRTGWTRIFIGAVKCKPRRLRSQARRVLLLGWLPPATLVAGAIAAAAAFATGASAAAIAAVACGLAMLLAQAVALALVYRLSGAPARSAITFPFGTLAVARILRDAARDLDERRTLRWGGREYRLEPR